MWTEGWQCCLPQPVSFPLHPCELRSTSPFSLLSIPFVFGLTSFRCSCITLISRHCVIILNQEGRCGLALQGLVTKDLQSGHEAYLSKLLLFSPESRERACHKQLNLLLVNVTAGVGCRGGKDLISSAHLIADLSIPSTYLDYMLHNMIPCLGRQ